MNSPFVYPHFDPVTCRVVQVSEVASWTDTYESVRASPELAQQLEEEYQRRYLGNFWRSPVVWVDVGPYINIRGRLFKRRVTSFEVLPLVSK